MKAAQREKWAQRRSKGMWHYVLINGVLSYGMPMFVTMTFIVHQQDLGARFIGLSAVLWTIGGAVFGIAMWYAMEYMYRKAGGGRT